MGRGWAWGRLQLCRLAIGSPAFGCYLLALAVLPLRWLSPIGSLYEHADWTDVLVGLAAALWLIERVRDRELAHALQSWQLPLLGYLALSVRLRGSRGARSRGKLEDGAADGGACGPGRDHRGLRVRAGKASGDRQGDRCVFDRDRGARRARAGPVLHPHPERAGRRLRRSVHSLPPVHAHPGWVREPAAACELLHLRVRRHGNQRRRVGAAPAVARGDSDQFRVALRAHVI